jgi:hypothetical protein
MAFSAWQDSRAVSVESAQSRAAEHANPGRQERFAKTPQFHPRPTLILWR